MNTMLIIYGVIACVIAGLIVAIIVLARKNADKKRNFNYFEAYARSEIESARANCEDEKEAIKKSIQENCDSKIAAIEADYKNKLQSYKEHIESRKEVLSKMDEKELLVNVMLALDTYGSRFEKIETFLNNDGIINRVDNMSQELDDQINGLTGSISKQIENMNLEIGRSLDHTNRLINSASDISAIQNKLDDIQDKLDSVNSDIEELQSNSHNSVDIESILSDLSNNQNSIDIDSVLSDLSNIENTVDNINSNVNDIYSNMTDKYNYNSLASNIDELTKTIQEIKDITEETKSEMDNFTLYH